MVHIAVKIAQAEGLVLSRISLFSVLVAARSPYHIAGTKKPPLADQVLSDLRRRSFASDRI